MSDQIITMMFVSIIIILAPPASYALEEVRSGAVNTTTHTYTAGPRTLGARCALAHS